MFSTLGPEAWRSCCQIKVQASRPVCVDLRPRCSEVSKWHHSHEEVKEIGCDSRSHLLLTKIHLGPWLLPSKSTSIPRSSSVCSAVETAGWSPEAKEFQSFVRPSLGQAAGRAGSERAANGRWGGRYMHRGLLSLRARRRGRAQTRPYTDVIKQNLSLICKCQQQYKRWSDDN